MYVHEGLDEHNASSVQVEGGSVEVVNHFKYLGSIILRDGEVTVGLDCTIVKAARAFSSLRKSVFQNRKLSIATTKTDLSSSGIVSSIVWS